MWVRALIYEHDYGLRCACLQDHHITDIVTKLYCIYVQQDSLQSLNVCFHSRAHQHGGVQERPRNTNKEKQTRIYLNALGIKRDTRRVCFVTPVAVHGAVVPRILAKATQHV